MHLNTTELRLFQIYFQLGVLIDGHPGDLLCPLLIVGIVSAALIADQKCTAVFLQVVPYKSEKAKSSPS